MLEGAVVSHAYPLDLMVDLDDIQSLEVSHQFNQDSNWLVLEDKDFKAVSYFDKPTQKALVVVLKDHETSGDFVDQVRKLGEFLLPMLDTMEGENEDAVIQQLHDAFELLQAKLSTSEMVMINFGQRIQELKGEKLDLLERLEAVVDLVPDLASKILILLAIHEDGLVLEDLTQMKRFKSLDLATLESTLEFLVKQGNVTFLPGIKRFKLDPSLQQSL